MSRIVGTSALVASRTVIPMARYRVAVPRRSRLRKTLISSYGSPRSRIGITSAAPARVSLLSLVVGCRAVPLPAAPEWVPVYRRRRSAYLCPLLRLVTPNWNEYLPVQCRVVGIPLRDLDSSLRHQFYSPLPYLVISPLHTFEWPIELY